MTNERIAELDRMASNAIRECRIQGQPDNPALGFWKGVKMVVDELKRDMETGREDDPAHGARAGNETRNARSRSGKDGSRHRFRRPAGKPVFRSPRHELQKNMER